MRRHLILAIVAVVAGALVVAGLGTLVLERHAAAKVARTQIQAQAKALATRADLALRPAELANIRAVARLNSARVLRLSPGGIPVGALPPGLNGADLHLASLESGRMVSGNQGDVAYAAVRLFPPREPSANLVLVITRRFSGPVNGVALLGLAIGATLIVAALVAIWLGRRISRPLEAAVAGTERIAGGDLDVAVPIPPNSYPELASLARSINTLAESLSRSKGLERQLLMSVSHDLRTPLTSIRGFAEAIADGTATEPARAAAVITAEARRLERLVRDLLELARLDARHFSLEVRKCEVGEIVADTAEGFRPALDDAGLGLEVTVDSGLWVSADPDRLAQMLANLVENAYKFADGKVTVRAFRARTAAEASIRPGAAADARTAAEASIRPGAAEARTAAEASIRPGAAADARTPADELVVVSVTDDGPGIPPGEAALAFDRLYQSARPPARQVGSGLGLAIVAELAEAMGIEVQSAAPELGGTEMVLSLVSVDRPGVLPGPTTPRKQGVGD